MAVGFRGAARELAERVGAEAEAWLAEEGRGVEAHHAGVVATGGARRLLLEPEPVFEGFVREDPELVHRGLLAALRASAKEGPGA